VETVHFLLVFLVERERNLKLKYLNVPIHFSVMQANYNYNNKSKEKGSCGEQGCVPVVRSVIKQAAQLLGCIGSKTQQWYHVEKQQHATTSSTPTFPSVATFQKQSMGRVSSPQCLTTPQMDSSNGYDKVGCQESVGSTTRDEQTVSSHSQAIKT